MPGTDIQDLRSFDDVVQLLESHPEWVARLRPLLFTKDLLALPEQIAPLTEQTTALGVAQGRIDTRLAELAEAQHRTEQRLTELAEAQRHTDQQIAALVLTV